METMLLHIGGHGAWSLLSPESLAVIFPTILVAIALAARPGTIVNRFVVGVLAAVSRPVRGRNH